MVASPLQVAKRALLATMRAVAVAFGMVLTCNRDSSDQDVVKDFRKLALRVHPDRPGGSGEQQQRLNDARGAWDTARTAAKGRGRPTKTSGNGHGPSGGTGAFLLQAVCPATKTRKEYRVNSSAMARC